MGKGNKKLPKAVYFQCIWVVKDIDRLRRLEAVANVSNGMGDPVFFVDEDEVIKDAEVLAEGVRKMRCIRDALNEVPKEYRQLTIDNIVYGVPLEDMAHENTWRRWRTVFIKELAKNLKLI